MRYRADYVTNSSSSSFVVSRKGQLSQAQKDALAAWVEREFMGSMEITQENLEEYADTFSDRRLGEIQEHLNAGERVFTGTVDWEIPCDIRTAYWDIWKILTKADPASFHVLMDIED